MSTGRTAAVTGVEALTEENKAREEAADLGPGAGAGAQGGEETDSQTGQVVIGGAIKDPGGGDPTKANTGGSH